MTTWLEKERQLFLNVFKRLPLEIERGEGCYLYDRTGRAYLDLLSGLGVNALGYGHPRVRQAIERQLNRNLHLSNYFIQDVQLELAEKVLHFSGKDRLFFSNSGTESIEGILKLVKKWGNLHGKHKIVCFENAFHGRSLGSLSVTAQEKYQKNFLPLLPQIEKLPYNDPRALRGAVDDQTAAIFLEFIQGEGGVVPADPEFVAAIREVQEKHRVLVVADEIQTGVGRTGRFLAVQHYRIEPDLIALAKAIGGGLPLGAFLINEELNDVLQRGEHGTTFGGNPVACAAGLATLQVMEAENLFDHVTAMGEHLRGRLLELQSDFPRLVKTVRGIGLMQAMQLEVDTYPIVLKGIEKGVIFNSTAGNVVRFLPPLIINQQQIDQGIEVLAEILQEYA